MTTNNQTAARDYFSVGREGLINDTTTTDREQRLIRRCGPGGDISNDATKAFPLGSTKQTKTQAAPAEEGSSAS